MSLCNDDSFESFVFLIMIDEGGDVRNDGFGFGIFWVWNDWEFRERGEKLI